MNPIISLFSIVACLQYLSGTTATQVQEVSFQGRLLLLNYSMLSASCANETLRLVNATYAFSPPGYYCEEANPMEAMCLLSLSPEEYGLNCENASGQFYLDQADFDPFQCTNVTDFRYSTFRVGVLNYPICAGVSCNLSELKTAVFATAMADGNNGPLRDSLYDGCDIEIPIDGSSSPSGAYNRWNGRATGTLFISLFTAFVTCKNVMYAFYAH
jgi:hypothetical protein